MSHELSGRFELSKPLATDVGVETYASVQPGHVVLVHIVTGGDLAEEGAMRRQLALLPEGDRRRVREVIPLTAGVAVVTDYLDGAPVVTRWIAQCLSKPATGTREAVRVAPAAPVDASPPVAPPAPVEASAPSEAPVPMDAPAPAPAPPRGAYTEIFGRVPPVPSAPAVPVAPPVTSVVPPFPPASPGPSADLPPRPFNPGLSVPPKGSGVTGVYRQLFGDEYGTPPVAPQVSVPPPVLDPPAPEPLPDFAPLPPEPVAAVPPPPGLTILPPPPVLVDPVPPFGPRWGPAPEPAPSSDYDRLIRRSPSPILPGDAGLSAAVSAVERKLPAPLLLILNGLMMLAVALAGLVFPRFSLPSAGAGGAGRDSVLVAPAITPAITPAGR